MLWLFGLSNLLLIPIFCSETYGEEEPFQCRTLQKFNGTSGDIYSPSYGKGEYTLGLWCEYLITAPVGYQLKLTFKDLDMAPRDFCTEAVILIYTNEQEKLIAKFCGRDTPDPFITDPGVNIVHITFSTEFFGSGRGFHLHYDAAPSFEYCGEGLTKCHNNRCYDASSQKCNGIDDCGDGTDEEGCNFPLDTSECGNPPIKPDLMVYGPDRIIGGQEVIPGSFPWQISMQNRRFSYSHSCGGSLINAQWVLTAAHCFKGNTIARNLRIHLGKHHKYMKGNLEQIRYVERIIIWPNKTADTDTDVSKTFNLDHDIGLMKLNAPVQFNDAVRPVCLPSMDQDLPAGTKCYVTGWGQTRGTGSNEALKQTYVTALSRWDCGYHEASQICVKNREMKSSTCHGDSGGPLSCKFEDRWYVMGATSFGTETNMQVGICGIGEQMTIFMRVAAKIDWIKSMIDLYG